MRLFFVLLMIGMVLVLPARAFAACTSPAGVEGQTVYDFPAHVLKYCDNTNWISISSGGAAAVTGLSDVTTTGVADGKILVYDGGTSKWVASTGGGVVQMKSGTTTTLTTSSSGTYVTTGATVTITPTSATNKILVRGSTTIENWGVGCYRQAEVLLQRDPSTSLGKANFVSYESSGNNSQVQPLSVEFLDSPATTSAVTYTLYFRRDWTSLVCAGPATAQYGNAMGIVTAEEIKP